MAKGFDTQRLIVTRQVLAQLVAGCSEPEAMTEIFRQVREVAFGRISVEAFDAHCKALPCILWQPQYEDECQITIRSRDHQDPVLVKVARVLWTIVHVCSSQGPELLGNEEVLHSCAHNGHPSTSRGACLNPAHLFRGKAADRLALRKARTAIKAIGMSQVAAQ